MEESPFLIDASNLCAFPLHSDVVAASSTVAVYLLIVDHVSLLSWVEESPAMAGLVLCYAVAYAVTTV